MGPCEFYYVIFIHCIKVKYSIRAIIVSDDNYINLFCDDSCFICFVKSQSFGDTLNQLLFKLTPIARRSSQLTENSIIK